MAETRNAHFVDLIQAAKTEDRLFTVLSEALEELVGFKVLTLLKFDPETFRSVRLFSSEPTYPVGGTKQHRRGVWSEHIVERLEPFVAATIEQVHDAFPDHAGIEAAGCGSTLSVPIVHQERPVGTLNLWHVSGFYSTQMAAQVLPFTPALVPLCLRNPSSPRSGVAESAAPATE